MTPVQFDALSKLLSLREGRSKRAAEMVLVHGRTAKDASIETGIGQPGVSNILARCRRGIELAKTLVG